MAQDAPLATAGSGDPAPEFTEVLESFIREKELKWLDESIPLLGGLSPRLAVSDPTRREDLVSLLDSFEVDEPGDFVSFDPARLKEGLGLREARDGGDGR